MEAADGCSGGRRETADTDDAVDDAHVYVCSGGYCSDHAFITVLGSGGMVTLYRRGGGIFRASYCFSSAFSAAACGGGMFRTGRLSRSPPSRALSVFAAHLGL